MGHLLGLRLFPGLLAGLLTLGTLGGDSISVCGIGDRLRGGFPGAFFFLLEQALIYGNAFDLGVALAMV